MEIRDADRRSARWCGCSGRTPTPMRILLAHVLGAIPAPRRRRPWSTGCSTESDSDVRHAIMDELERRKEPEVTRPLVQALRVEHARGRQPGRVGAGEPERGLGRPEPGRRPRHDAATRWSWPRRPAGRRTGRAIARDVRLGPAHIGDGRGPDRLQRQLDRLT